VGHINHHSDPVHFGNDLAAEAGNAAVFSFVATTGQKTLVVVGKAA